MTGWLDERRGQLDGNEPFDAFTGYLDLIGQRREEEADAVIDTRETVVPQNNVGPGSAGAGGVAQVGVAVGNAESKKQGIFAGACPYRIGLGAVEEYFGRLGHFVVLLATDDACHQKESGQYA